MKKMMLLALAVASVAMFALPAAASANVWHISQTGGFTIEGAGPTNLSTTTGETITCAGKTTGSGTYETTTTGSMTITFNGPCTTQFIGTINCVTAGEANNSIVTTKLPFHNAVLGGKPGILVTPPADGAFAHFVCGGILPVTVTGNGVLGTVTNRACGATAANATVDFNATAHGKQEHTLYTGVTYNLKKGEATSAQDTTATVTFPGNRTITCT